MPSIIPGYEYDIFISYRQKDNRSGRQGAPSYGATQSREAGWVSEFIESLKTELESTFKEEISVYFDESPHDGLSDMHDADASIREKLKCLIFIPVISRIYCDPKSFAWEHEFKAFVELASNDQFGLKVRLSNGNVASRVLPVRIHDLDNTDISLCESVTGGVLRGVEFIYKSPGVNRPLRPEEEKARDNINNTIYRDQINKVALAIKDIILGLKSGSVVNVIETGQEKELIEEVRQSGGKGPAGQHSKIVMSKFLSGAVILTLLIIAAIIFYPKIFNSNNLTGQRFADNRISVAILPFKNLTNDEELDVHQEVIQDELINYLTNYQEELRVVPVEKINTLLHEQGITKNKYASLSQAMVRNLSATLGADVFITGTINQSGTVFRINVQLSDSETGEVLKPFINEGIIKGGSIFQIIDPLKEEIKNYLIISGLKEQVYIDPTRTGSTDSLEAYRYFIYGQKAFANGDFPEAIKLLSQAVHHDSNLVYASLHIGWAYFNLENYDSAKVWCDKVYRKRSQLPFNLEAYVNFVHARFTGMPNEAIRYLKQLQDIDDRWPHLHYDMGSTYSSMEQYDKSIPEYLLSLEMYGTEGKKPRWVSNYACLGKAYHETGQYYEEKRLYKKALKDFPENPAIIGRQAILAFSEGNTNEGEKLLEEYESVRKGNSDPESSIFTGVAHICSEAGILDKAELYYRQVLSSEPGDPKTLYNIAWFLIDRKQDFNEGLELIEKALKQQPDNYLYLDCKGWGLYSQGKVKEAQILIERAWNLRPVYYHRIFLHLDKVKKAMAGQEE